MARSPGTAGLNVRGSHHDATSVRTTPEPAGMSELVKDFLHRTREEDLLRGARAQTISCAPRGVVGGDEPEARDAASAWSQRRHLEQEGSALSGAALRLRGIVLPVQCRGSTSFVTLAL